MLAGNRAMPAGQVAGHVVSRAVPEDRRLRRASDDLGTRPPLRARPSASAGMDAIGSAICEAAEEGGVTGRPSRAVFQLPPSRVQVRYDARADRSARLLGARAVAFGDTVMFRSGDYAPGSEQGRALIAHELTHVALQYQSGRRQPQRSVAGDVLSVQFTAAMAEAMTNEELGQQIQLLLAHLQVEPADQGAAENLAVLQQVAQSRQQQQSQPSPAAGSATAPAASAPVPAQDAGTQPPAQDTATPSPSPQPAPAMVAEEKHGWFWWWLHSLGLVQTKHENAEILRKGWGRESGVVITDDDGDPVDVDRLSDDEVIELDRKYRGLPIGPPIVLSAVTWPLACDAIGKIHGELPKASEAQQKINSMTREQLEQSAEELDKSIATRKAEQVNLGEEGKHRARIGQEEDLLRAVRKKLSGS